MKALSTPLLLLFTLVLLLTSLVHTQRSYRVQTLDSIPDIGNGVSSITGMKTSSGHYITYTYNQMIKHCSLTTTSSPSCAIDAGQPGVSGSNDGDNALMNNPTSLQQNSMFADSGNHKIRKVTSNGIKSVSTIVGAGVKGYLDGASKTAQFNNPTGLFLGSSDILYIADSGNNRIRKFENGQVTTIAGSGEFGFSGDNGPAIKATLSTPNSVTAIGDTVFVMDSLANRIRKISSDGNMTTFAGNGLKGSSGDAGPAVNAKIDPQGSIFITAKYEVFFADVTSNTIRFILPNQKIYTVAQIQNLNVIYVFDSYNIYAHATDGKIYYIYASDGCNNFADTYIDGQCVPVCSGKSLDAACGGPLRGKCASANFCSCKSGFYGSECASGTLRNGFSIILLVAMTLIAFTML